MAHMLRHFVILPRMVYHLIGWYAVGIKKKIIKIKI